MQAEFNFLVSTAEKPRYQASSAGRDAAHRVDQPMHLVKAEVQDARLRSDQDAVTEFGMHPSGFDLFSFPSRVSDFSQPDQIKSIYETEIEDFVKATTGAKRVVVFDHTLRASAAEIRQTKNVREPASLVHNDYTARSGYTCLRENLGEEATELSKSRFQILNLWRPLVDPVEDYPLALCDARSLQPDDLVSAERRAVNHIGEIQLAKYSPQQRWHYYAEMRPFEALLFKTFDSINDGNNPCSIHTAIHLPDAPSDATPRESIESRMFVFYS